MGLFVRILRSVAVLFAALILVPNAAATFHTFRIDQVYSNADGTLQYVMLRESANLNGQDLFAGHELSTRQGTVKQSIKFPDDLPSAFTAGRKVLIATSAFAVRTGTMPDYMIPDGFIPTAGGQLEFDVVDQIVLPPLPSDGVSAIDRNGNVIPGVATNFGGQSVAMAGLPPAIASYQGLWWNAPAASESGWGINLAHQGTVIFATWFTYDVNGKAWWLSMTADQIAPNTFTGTLVETHGPGFNAMPFNSTLVTHSAVGSATLTFSDANNGTFAYTVNGVAQTKTLTRQVFASPVPACTFGTQSNLALATNFQDLWWNAPAESESGWGINFTHQGDVIFATWFTYDLDGTPLWLSMTANKTGAGAYAGALVKTNGPAFNAAPFNPGLVGRAEVGAATLSFVDGNHATFAYTVNGVAQTKALTRQVFRMPGTMCR